MPCATNHKTQESLVRQPNLNAGRELDVEYSILLSPTYQVPVLYFSLIDRRTGIPRPAAGGLDAVYDQFVPAQFRTGLRDVGVLGGISVGVCFILVFFFFFLFFSFCRFCFDGRDSGSVSAAYTSNADSDVM